MAFSLPTFNLVCNIHSGDVWPPPPMRLSSPCNLAMGRRVNQLNEPSSGGAGFPIGVGPLLLLPAGTDIRDASCGLVTDLVECPAGSGRWYQTGLVDDAAKGFSNEYRVAYLLKIYEGVSGAGSWPGLLWPTPIP